MTALNCLQILFIYWDVVVVHTIHQIFKGAAKNERGGLGSGRRHYAGVGQALPQPVDAWTPASS